MAGVKYLLRTELLFRRVGSAVARPAFDSFADAASLRIAALYDESDRRFENRDAAGAKAKTTDL